MSDPKKVFTREELEEHLTEKRKRFCKEYIVDWNASRAAKEAGFSPKTAYSIGHEYLKKPEIQQYIAFIKNDYENETGISKLRNLKELAKIAYSSIADIHNTWIDRKEFESLNPEQKACIESIDSKVIKSDKKGYKVEQVKVKLYSKKDAIELINRMMGYNDPDKIDHTTKGDKIQLEIVESKNK